MPPQLLIDLERVDLDRIAYDVPGIERYNPHRGAMRSDRSRPPLVSSFSFGQYPSHSRRF